MSVQCPLCPVCEKGNLLPMSAGNVTYYFWICSSPSCRYMIKFEKMPMKRYATEKVVIDEE